MDEQQPWYFVTTLNPNTLMTRGIVKRPRWRHVLQTLVFVLQTLAYGTVVSGGVTAVFTAVVLFIGAIFSKSPAELLLFIAVAFGLAGLLAGLAGSLVGCAVAVLISSLRRVSVVGLVLGSVAANLAVVPPLLYSNGVQRIFVWIFIPGAAASAFVMARLWSRRRRRMDAA